MSIAAVVLAAGEASRFGTPKQRLLLPEVLERLTQSSVDEIVVVAGAHTLETPATRRHLRGLEARPGRIARRAGLEELGAASRPPSSFSPTGPTSRPKPSSA